MPSGGQAAYVLEQEPDLDGRRLVEVEPRARLGRHARAIDIVGIEVQDGHGPVPTAQLLHERPLAGTAASRDSENARPSWIEGHHPSLICHPRSLPTLARP